MMVVIAGNVASSAAFDFTDGMRKAIPVGFTLSIGVPRPFNLVGGGCQAPKKSIRKSRTVYLRARDCGGNIFFEKWENRRKTPEVPTEAPGRGRTRFYQKSDRH